MSVLLASNELKQLIKLHAAHIYSWANVTEAKPGNVSPEGKEALLDIAARMYECLEALPVREQKKVS